MAYYFRRSVLQSRLVTRQVMFLQPQKFSLRNSNPVLFQSSLSRSYTNSTFHSSPPNTPSEESISSSNLRKIVKDFAKRLPVAIFVNLFIAGVVIFVPVDLLYAWCRNRYNERLLINTVEKGTRPDVEISEDELVSRTEVIERLKKVLQPHKGQSKYHVICGENGTGKTTLARIASREVGQDKDKGIQGGMGVIYVEIPADAKDIEEFGIAFGKSLNFAFEEKISFTVQFMNKVLGHTNGKIERPKWKRALDAFKRAGEVYEAKHDKPPVIVYDNIAKLINVNPNVLDTLQGDAKMNADHRKYIAVFVSSEGSVRRMRLSRSAWSRATQPMEIGDLTEKESLNYLANKRGIKTVREGKINTTEAKRIYELVGGRIMDLNSVAEEFLKGRDLEDIKKELLIKVEDKLRVAKLLENYEHYEIGKRIFKALLDSKKLSRIAYENFFKKPEEANKVLGSNVFAYHPKKNTVTFQSQSVECYVRENANIFLK